MTGLENPTPMNTVLNVNVQEEGDRRIWVTETLDEIRAMMRPAPEFIVVHRVMGPRAVRMSLRTARIITVQEADSVE